jgi:hypothetical protein
MSDSFEHDGQERYIVEHGREGMASEGMEGSRAGNWVGTAI